MWRRPVARWILCAVVIGGPAKAEAQVLLGFVDSEARFAVQGAVQGAAARLARPSCQKVLSDFVDESGLDLETRLLASGRSPTDAFAALRFVDGRASPQCSSGTTLAFTQVGSPLIHVCGKPFIKRSLRNRMAAEVIVIHEFLHSLGLGENPPTSQAITEQVVVRCGG